ncbi:hypothetical protein ADUPG1_003931, partial [Aduncisulcus paluster]
MNKEKTTSTLVTINYNSTPTMIEPVTTSHSDMGGRKEVEEIFTEENETTEDKLERIAQEKQKKEAAALAELKRKEFYSRLSEPTAPPKSRGSSTGLEHKYPTLFKRRRAQAVAPSISIYQPMSVPTSYQTLQTLMKNPNSVLTSDNSPYLQLLKQFQTSGQDPSGFSDELYKQQLDEWQSRFLQQLSVEAKESAKSPFDHSSP